MTHHDQTIGQAFVLAAGFAKRMRPLTDTLPKPLVELGGKPLLGHIFDHLQRENVQRVVVNGHHCIGPLRDYIAGAGALYKGMEIILSEEETLLDTGGGAIKAMDYLDRSRPFYMINGDSYWTNPPRQTSLSALRDIWNNEAMDVLLLLQNVNGMHLTGPVGDYKLIDGQGVRAADRDGTHMFSGVRIVHPRALEHYGSGQAFSFLKVMDEAEAQYRLYGCDHDGEWHHISTPEDLLNVQKTLFSKAP